MKNVLFGLLALSMFAITFSNCKKEDETIKGFGSISLEFDNQAGDEALILGQTYKNANGDSMKFSQFDYYISNLIFVKTDGTEYTVPKDSSYFLCKHDNEDSRVVTVKNVPAGDYKSVRFTIGVDSTKSVSDISQRTGVLDPTGAASGMYWAWNAGYIFVKVEGTSPQAPLDPGSGEHIFQYHTGLFGGKDAPTLNNLKKVTISATDENALVRQDKATPQFHIYVDLMSMFTSPVNISVAENPYSHTGDYSKTVADNYADMFKLDHVHNP
jgi:hypothetical protein